MPDTNTDTRSLAPEEPQATGGLSSRRSRSPAPLNLGSEGTAPQNTEEGEKSRKISKDSAYGTAAVLNTSSATWFSSDELGNTTFMATSSNKKCTFHLGNPMLYPEMEETAPWAEPMFPDLKNVGTRANTFQLWPRNSLQDHVPLLKDAGFFYTGQGDVVRCFGCGLRLMGWMPHHQPRVEHVRYLRFCPLYPADQVDQLRRLLHQAAKCPTLTLEQNLVERETEKVFKIQLRGSWTSELLPEDHNAMD